jgi:CRP-like cAMP-binding protein
VLLYDTMEILKRSPLLAGLAEGDLQTLSQSCTLKKLTPGTDLIRLGSVSQALYTVVRGSLSVFIGANIEVAIIKSGGMVGEISLLTGTPAVSTCRAREEVYVCVCVCVCTQTYVCV